MTGEFGKMVEMKGGGCQDLCYFDGQKKQTEKNSPVPGLIHVLLPNRGEEIGHECSLGVFMSM